MVVVLVFIFESRSENEIAYLCIQREEEIDSKVSGTMNVFLDSLTDILETPA